MNFWWGQKNVKIILMKHTYNDIKIQITLGAIEGGRNSDKLFT